MQMITSLSKLVTNSVAPGLGNMYFFFFFEVSYFSGFVNLLCDSFYFLRLWLRFMIVTLKVKYACVMV